MIRLKRLYAHDFKQLREIDLRFPDAGRILVQGKNEAGKSTLFEAVFFALFGQALATEGTGRANLDDLIGYERNKARVELDFTIRDRLFKIKRTLNRGKPNVWQLEIVDGERVEEIRGNKPVNERLVSELGFDSEALLNTCFVEQKKLEKLEGLNRARREESLSKLLNLERLLDLEERLKLRTDDEKMLSRLAKRVELAEAQEQLPELTEELRKAEGELRMIELKEQVAKATEEKRAVDGLGSRLVEMRARREQLRSAVSQVDTLDKARHSLAGCLDRFDLLAQQTQTLESQRKERADIERAVSEHLPILRLSDRGLGRLGRHLTRLKLVEAAGDTAARELERLALVQEEVQVQSGRNETLAAAIAEHEARAAQLDRMLHDYQAGEVLGEWIGRAREVITESSIEQQILDKTREREQASAHLKATLVAPGILFIVLVAATVFVPLGLLLVTRNPSLAAASGGALLLADAGLAVVLARRALEVWSELERATEELGKAQGEAETRRGMAKASQEKLREVEGQLKQLGAPVPADPEIAQVWRIEIARNLENKTRDELNAERDAVHEKLNYARAQRDDVIAKLGQLEGATSNGRGSYLERKALRANGIRSRWRPLLEEQASQLRVDLDLQSVRDQRQSVRSEIKSWQSRIEQADKLRKQIAEGEARAQTLSRELKRAYEPARALVNGPLPDWAPSLPRPAYMDLGWALTKAFEAYGGNQVRAELNALEKELGACEQEAKMRERSLQEAVAKARAVLQAIGVSDLSGQPSQEELDELEGRLNKIEVEDRPTLETRVRMLHQRVGSLADTQRRLEGELGLNGEMVELLAAREELEKERRAQEERKHGAEIIVRARKRIVQKVLPATMDYMRRILPQLTRDRYHDAELDPETYKIRVWDERAGQSGAWKEKNIFSGGTRDQFSLALRLAFALATMPLERGASPGFIFLDEPLGSFDDERASALLYLLTEGEIGRAFDQIFLISHVRVDESRFTDRVRLDDGTVVESTLS